MSLVLPLDNWPESDKKLWGAAFAKGGPLDNQGPLVHLRDTTRKSLADRYGRWLQWLWDRDVPAISLPPCDRVTEERVRRWLADLEHTVPLTRLAFVEGVLRLVTAAQPDGDWAWLRKLRAGLKRAARCVRSSRKDGRILSSSVLLGAGIRLAAEAHERAQNTLFAALFVRDGTMIALLSLMPTRLRALANLRIGESVFISETTVTISLPLELTKSGVPWEADVPAQVLPVLHRYLSAARPILAARGDGRDNHLWLNRDGNALHYSAIGPRMTQQTELMTGVKVSPHLFRDAAATWLARDSVEGAKIIRPILAHSGFKTAERHYIHAQSIEAGRGYATLVAELKEMEE